MNIAPGLKRRGKAWYWVAANCCRKAKDYPIKTVRLIEADHEARAARCRNLYAELMAWMANREAMNPALADNGTVASVCDFYQRHEDSPYHGVKRDTQLVYDHSIKILKHVVGTRLLSKLTGPDFIHWHKQLVAHKGERKIDRAHRVMSMWRRVVRWGVVLEIPDCLRLDAILSRMEFKAPKPRTTIMTYDQCRAIITEAKRHGRYSIALTQAMQFELTMRRIDIIGAWERDPHPKGIVLAHKNTRYGQRWTGGLTWSHIDENLILRKIASKTEARSGASHVFDLKLYPLVMAELSLYHAGNRVGPIVINEKTGLPYTKHVYAETWRTIARAAGVPDDIWSMDSRAGGITEGSDAGADLESLRHHAAHSDPKMTARYSRKTLSKTQEVAAKRNLYRLERAKNE
jgi:hypothetical protein